MITSTTNSKVKLARALHRRRRRYQARLFLVEGVRLLEEVVRAGVQPALVFYTAGLCADARGQALLNRLGTLTDELYEVSDRVMRTIADTITPQGIVAIVPFPDRSSPKKPTLTLIVDGLQDPGNLGSLLRSAAAAGVDHVILTSNSVDPYNPKVVRAGMGAHFHLPLTISENWDEIAKLTAGQAVWIADVGAQRAYCDIDWTRPAALVIGSEAHGAGAEAHRLATGHIAIPMAGEVESLNAAVAASVILFEARRQRTAAKPAHLPTHSREK